jgi:Dual-action HEIGH metallo-peptidase
MKNLLRMLAILCIASLTIIGCKKNSLQPQQDEISQDVLTQIHNIGFSNTNVQKVDEGYLVEGDIILTQNDFRSTTPVTLIRVNEEQYRTTNLVKSLPRVITVALSGLPSAYNAVLVEMVRRYNALNLQIQFSIVSSGATITFTTAQKNVSYLASSGFPDAQGNPYPTVKVNTLAISSGDPLKFVNFAATIFAHEVGHCIGFRHTDYYNRGYSCGGFFSNEGASSSGAINIQGTPTLAEPQSFMLACVSINQNRPFDAYDVTALKYLY